MPDAKTIPDWKLERFLLNELPPAEQQALAAQIAADPGEQARLQALRDSNAAILAAHPPADAAAAIRRKAHLAEARERAMTPARAPHRVWFSLVPAMAAVVLAVLVFLPGGPGNDDVTRIKGMQPRLLLYRQASAGAEPIASNASAGAGEVLQIAYVAAGRTYGAVISIDGTGVVTRHLPETGSAAVRLLPNGEVPLPHAYELDAAPGFERFFLITSAEPFDAGVAEQAARKLAASNIAATAALVLPPGFEQTGVLLRKR